MKRHEWLVFAALIAWVAPGTLWAESYTIDPAKSQVGFAIGFTFGTVRGSFEQFEGRAEMDGGKLVAVEGTAKAASINTNNRRRDSHLRNDHFFWADKYPDITFRSASVQSGADGSLRVIGPLTMRGVTKEVTLTGTLAPAGDGRYAFKAAAKVNRQEWGIVWSRHLDGMSLLIQDEVDLALDGELAKAN